MEPFQSDTDFAQEVFDMTQGAFDITKEYMEPPLPPLPWMETLAHLHKKAAAYLGIKP